MSDASWLASRTPPAPAPLAQRVGSALGAEANRGGRTGDRLVAAAEVQLSDRLRNGCATRAAAHDLLTTDALVTYAFEAAAEEDPATIESRAAAAMRRIAALGLEAGA
jgi:hypothetical protein